MQFKPNLDLYVEWESAKFIARPPYIAVFKKENKTLVYFCDDHVSNKSFDMVDFCFSKSAPARPDVAVIEYGIFDRVVKSPRWYQDLPLVYALGVATKAGVPVVFADMFIEGVTKLLENYAPDKHFTEDYITEILRAGGPSRTKGELQRLAWELDVNGRDPFMLKNIAAALNKYDVVFAGFGEGHFRSQRLVIEDMMGEPEYIKEVPNSRGNFEGLEIKPINLID